MPLKTIERCVTRWKKIILFSTGILLLCGIGIGACSQQDDSELIDLVRNQEGAVATKSGDALLILRINNPEAVPILLPHLHQANNLRALYIGNVDLTDEQLQEIGSLTQIRCLSLNHCEIDDDDLRQLKGLRKISRLFLSRNPISGEGLRHLTDMEELRQIEISWTDVSGPGIEHLNLPHLHTLRLNHTPIGDEGIEYITLLTDTRLGTLDLHATNITQEGMMKLVDLHWLSGLNVPDDIAGALNDDEQVQRQEMMVLSARFHEAHILSKQTARAAGEDVPEDEISPYNYSYDKIHPNREPGEE